MKTERRFEEDLWEEQTEKRWIRQTFKAGNQKHQAKLWTDAITEFSQSLTDRRKNKR